MKSTSIRKRIAYGYAWPLCIAFAGIGFGLLAGSHYIHRALAIQEAAIAERKLFDEVRIKILAHRPAKQFTPTLDDPAAFEAESEVLLNLLTDVRHVSSQHKDIHNSMHNMRALKVQESHDETIADQPLTAEQPQFAEGIEQGVDSDLGIGSAKDLRKNNLNYSDC
ncbi:MAG: hypothetical protein ACFBSF_22830 [Leptolyngbyaceae cyanobacterium]